MARKKHRWEERDGVFGKVCPICEEWKAANEYHGDPSTKIRKGSYCIECVRKQRNITGNRRKGPRGWSWRGGWYGRECAKCDEWKSEGEYYRDKRRPSGRQPYCKTCFSEPKFREKRNAHSRKEYRRKYQWLVDMDWKCQQCGENRFPTLDFHHINPSTKTHGVGIGGMIGRYGRKKILEEIKKCICLCSNCHRMLHWQE